MRSVADLSAPGRLDSVAATPHVWLFDAALMQSGVCSHIQAGLAQGSAESQFGTGVARAVGPHDVADGLAARRRVR